ncbi:MAG: glycosyltransferase [Elusimicrobia bacterium]|nr:glycosyltransferase [Elusimicrobiota bacterium]
MSVGRVLFLSESQGWSGGAKQLLRLAEGLRVLGWDVRIACPGDGELFRRARASGFEPVDLHPRQDYDVLSAVRVARLMEKERVDLLHAHHPRAHAVGLMAAYLCRRAVRFLVTRRVSFPPGKNPFSRFKYASRRIDAFVAVAESIRQDLIAAGVEPERVHTVRSGVDLELFHPLPRDERFARELGLPADVPLIGKVANYSAWKGQDVALQAAARLKRDGRRALFVFAGRDTDSPELRAKAEALGLGPSDVRFLGFVTEVPRLLSLLAVSVNSAREGEGISGALRESLAMGVPCVASDVGGNRELIEDGVTGRVFPGGSGDGLAAAIAALLGDPAGAAKLAEAGRLRVQERLGLERVVAQIDGLYRALLAARSSLRAEPSASHAASTEMSRQDSQEAETTL